MRSEEDNRARKLLNKWKTTQAFVQLSFNAIGDCLAFELRGIIVELSDDALRFEGAGSNAFLDLRGAGFQDTVTDELLSRLGRSGTQSEGTQAVLRAGGSCLLVASEVNRPQHRQ